MFDVQVFPSSIFSISLIYKQKKRIFFQATKKLPFRSPLDRYEIEYRLKGFLRIAGIDEAGRGPLAGPVAAAAVILPEKHDIANLNDSKKLSASQRENLYLKIQGKAISIGVGWADPEEIDRINILQATRLAMLRAVQGLREKPDCLFIDGITPIESDIIQITIKKGDSLSESVAAASIIAKVARDQIMKDLHIAYPAYMFNQHKGYGTKDHLERIKTYGPCPIHRKTFKGVKEFLHANI
jgi:ribonuclease HII